MTAELRPIPGYEGAYSATSDGQVWSHAKATGVSNHAGKWLKPWRTNGYLVVALKGQGGKVKKYVHRLVAAAWVPNPDPGSRLFINHIDGNPANCAAANLEWCDRSHNLKHAYDVGLRRDPRFTKVGANVRLLAVKRRVLTDAQAADVKRRHAGGESARQIAISLERSPTTVLNLIRGRTYRTPCQST